MTTPILQSLVEKRDALLAETRALVTNPEATDNDLDTAEARHAELVKLDERIAAQEAIEARFAQAAETRAANGDIPVVRVKSEARTYTPESGNSFFIDAYRSQFAGDWQAQDRIARHAREEQVERRAIGTGAMAGLVVPQYLTAQVAELARAGQPLVEVSNRLPLPPEGMTVNISRITTGSSVAVQAAENDSVSNTNIDDTLLTTNVITLAGQQDVSRQLLERGTSGLDQIIFRDLVAAHAVAKDTQLISGAGSNGEALGILGTTGINATTFTSTQPTVAAFYSKLAGAISQVATSRYLPATHIVLHPRRWSWLCAAADSSNRPLIVPQVNNPFNAMGSGSTAAYGPVVGNILGLNVVTDANIPTTWASGASNTSGTEDVAIVVRAADVLVMEDGDGLPRELRFEQTSGGNLTVKLVAYSYNALVGVGRYPGAAAVVKGTGMVAPSF